MKPSARILTATCGAHMLQDGLVALQFVLLPVLAQVFGLNYAQVGLIRAVNNGALSLLEIPSGILAERSGEKKLLVMGLVCAGIGYIGVALSSSYVGLLACFLFAGIGAGFQHSLSSSLIVNAYGASGRRQALGIYNSFGDAGKLTFTGLFSAALGAGFAWTPVVIALGGIVVVFGLMVFLVLQLPKSKQAPGEEIAQDNNRVESKWGIKSPRRFWTLGAVVFLDSTIQAVFLTFLAFVLLDRGADAALASVAVVVALAGGMVGKFSCGFLAAKTGDRVAFILIQILTVIGIAGLILLPVKWVLVCLPLIGMVVQGSSTITYGSVADYIDDDKQARGYSLIYTLANGSSVTGPFLIGLFADRYGLDIAMWSMCLLALMTIALGLFTVSGKQTVGDPIKV